MSTDDKLKLDEIDDVSQANPTYCVLEDMVYQDHLEQQHLDHAAKNNDNNRDIWCTVFTIFMILGAAKLLSPWICLPVVFYALYKWDGI